MKSIINSGELLPIDNELGFYWNYCIDKIQIQMFGFENIYGPRFDELVSMIISGHDGEVIHVASRRVHYNELVIPTLKEETDLEDSQILCAIENINNANILISNLNGSLLPWNSQIIYLKESLFEYLTIFSKENICPNGMIKIKYPSGFGYGNNFKEIYFNDDGFSLKIGNDNRNITNSGLNGNPEPICDQIKMLVIDAIYLLPYRMTKSVSDKYWSLSKVLTTNVLKIKNPPIEEIEISKSIMNFNNLQDLGPDSF